MIEETLITKDGHWILALQCFGHLKGLSCKIEPWDQDLHHKTNNWVQSL